MYDNVVKTTIATMRCIKCNNNLCDTCCRCMHEKLKGYLLHKIVDLRISEFQNDIIGRLCTVHTDKEITVYCNCHETLCCTFCVPSKHSECDTLTFLDGISEDDIKLYTQTLFDETLEMRRILKVAIHEIKENIKGFQNEGILSNPAESIRVIKETLDAEYCKFTNSLDKDHADILPMLNCILEKFASFEDTISQIAKIAYEVLHDTRKNHMSAALAEMREMISNQLKLITKQRDDMTFVHLKWDDVSSIENLEIMRKIGEFQYWLQPVDWINQIDEHLSIIKNYINPSDLGRYLSYHIKYLT